MIAPLVVRLHRSRPKPEAGTLQWRRAKHPAMTSLYNTIFPSGLFPSANAMAYTLFLLALLLPDRSEKSKLRSRHAIVEPSTAERRSS